MVRSSLLLGAVLVVLSDIVVVVDVSEEVEVGVAFNDANNRLLVAVVAVVVVGVMVVLVVVGRILVVVLVVTLYGVL